MSQIQDQFSTSDLTNTVLALFVCSSYQTDIVLALLRYTYCDLHPICVPIYQVLVLIFLPIPFPTAATWCICFIDIRPTQVAFIVPPGVIIQMLWVTMHQTPGTERREENMPENVLVQYSWVASQMQMDLLDKLEIVEH
jgi:hypothetical protein